MCVVGVSGLGTDRFLSIFFLRVLFDRWRSKSNQNQNTRTDAIEEFVTQFYEIKLNYVGVVMLEIPRV